MTVKAGFKSLMLEEMEAQGIMLIDAERKNYNLAMKRFKEEVKSKISFKHVLPFKKFIWW